MLAWLGRVPGQFGYAAGGSMTSDEFKVLLTVLLPMIMSIHWF